MLEGYEAHGSVCARAVVLAGAIANSAKASLQWLSVTLNYACMPNGLVIRADFSITTRWEDCRTVPTSRLSRLNRSYTECFRTFEVIFKLILDFLSLAEGPSARTYDLGIVRKYLFTSVVRSDESEPFRVVK